MPEQNEGLSTWLPEELSRQLAHVLESMIGESPSLSIAPYPVTAEDLQPGGTGLLWWEQPFSLSPEARIWIGADTGSWETIGNQVLQSAGVEDNDTESIRGTYLEIVSQALSGIASALSSRAHKEVACQEGRQGPPPPAEDGSFRFEVSLGDKRLPILAVFAKTLEKLNDSSIVADAPKGSEQQKAGSVAGEPAIPSPIDLLLDVELPVSVSFGRAQLPLKDVIKLTTGSIVELNRAISEPVDVIVNNCVIARGEVVVVEGNYGIRIRQVISRQERLRTLY